MQNQSQGILVEESQEAQFQIYAAEEELEDDENDIEGNQTRQVYKTEMTLHCLKGSIEKQEYPKQNYSQADVEINQNYEEQNAMNSPNIAIEGQVQDAAFFSRENTKMQLSSGNSSQGNHYNSSSSQIQAERTDVQVDRLHVEKLKSPKPDTNFKADWQLLIDEALGDELANDDDIDNKAFDSQQVKETINYTKSIYVNSQKANERYQVYSCSDRLTDHSRSPVHSPELQTQNQNAGGMSNSLCIQNISSSTTNNRQSKKHYYDPHEPHSALNHPKKQNSILIQSGMGGKFVDKVEDRNEVQEGSSKNDKCGEWRGRGWGGVRASTASSTLLKTTNLASRAGKSRDNYEDNQQEEKFIDQKSRGSDGLVMQSNKSTSDRKREYGSIILAHDQNKLSLCSPDKLPHDDPGVQQLNQNQFHFNTNEQPNQIQNNLQMAEIFGTDCMAEVDLVDDGFFDQLMENVNKKQKSNQQEQQKHNNDSNNNKLNIDFYRDSSKSIDGSSNNSQNSSEYDFKIEANFVEEDQEAAEVEIIKETPNLTKQCQQHIMQTYNPERFIRNQIFQGMMRNELSQLSRPFDNNKIFIAQPSLTPQMRLILLDWMCQVASDYCLKRRTFHMALKYVDFYLLMSKDNLQTQHFQLLGITCLHIAAKLEEIYPPHIAAFVESTNNSVSEQQMMSLEFKICNTLRWKLTEVVTIYDWATWYMSEWDRYVDGSLSYLKQQFALKFYDNSYQSLHKFKTVMQFTDAVAIDGASSQFLARHLVAAIMYLILGGKDIMCAFQFEYSDMNAVFAFQLPIQEGAQRLPEGILFYNQIISPFFVQHFQLHLNDLIGPLSHILPLFALEIRDNVLNNDQLLERSKMVVKQYDNIVLEKVYQLLQEQQFDNQQVSDQARIFTDEIVINYHYNELVSFQDFNCNLLEHLKNVHQNRVAQSCSQESEPTFISQNLQHTTLLSDCAV